MAVAVVAAAGVAAALTVAAPGNGGTAGGHAVSVAPAAFAASAADAYQAPDTPSPSVAGATTPFVTYQAPEGSLGGGASVVSLTSAPTSQYDSAQGEASGHAYVQLTGTGQSVQWTNQTGQPINFVNVRGSIPDSAGGGGTTATLDLYVNGVFRQALNMNSIQSWEYEGDNNYQGSDENAGDGDPRDFWDEFHATISGTPIPAGATLSLQKDSSNSASFYWINSIDLWNAPAPAAQPANSISITSCGAVADNTPTNGTAAPGAQDSTADIQNCINQAASQGKILWIPQGTFYTDTSGLVVNNITVEGAGYWYSEIYRNIPLPNNVGLGAAFQCYSCHLENFHIDSDAMSRTSVDGGAGAEDTTGTNWSISGMWVQHVESSVWASGTGGTVSNNLFTVIFADGCNLNNVSLTGTSGSNLTATNNFIRGTGDDGMAINSVAYNTNGSTTTTYTAMTNITMTHNTMIAAWGGKGIGVYGGSGHQVNDNYIADTSRFIGLGVGRFGVNGSDMTGATVSGNVIVRSGGNAYVQGQPALQIGNGGDGQNVGVVSNADVTGNSVIQSVYDAVGFSTGTSNTLSNNTITNPWRNGIVISPPFYPAPTGSATITGNSVTGLTSGHTAYANDSTGFTASVSGNSWQTTTAEGPYGGTAAAVPGTVQAANYDTGGQGVAYNVSSVNGSANSYRTDGVNLETCTDTGCGEDLGWTATGQWFKYTVNVASAGTYTVGVRYASPSAVTDALHIASASGTNLSGSVNLPATGGWQTWATANATITLPAGVQTLTVDQDNGGWNLHDFALTAGSSGGGGINTSAWYEVVNTNSGLCASAAAAGTANGTAVQQLACTGATSQLWQFASAATGYYEVLNDNAQSEGESWNITGGVGATANGALLQLWNYGGAGNTNALFAATAQSTGGYTLTADNSRLCIDVPNASTSSGIQLEQYTCNGTPAQTFNLIQH